MASSGTYNFEWSLSALIEQAQERAGSDIESVEFRDNRFIVRELNALFSDMANNGPNLWAIDLQTVNLSPNQTTFTAPSSTVDLLEVVLRRDDVDYILTRFDRQDYMELPNKTQAGRPTNFWVDKQIPQYTVYMWPITDISGDQIRYYRMVQLQDVTASGPQTFDLPYLWTDAICYGLAYRLAMRAVMKPNAMMTLDKVQFLKSAYEQSFFNAVRQNSDKTPLTLDVQAGEYWRI